MIPHRRVYKHDLTLYFDNKADNRLSRRVAESRLASEASVISFASRFMNLPQLTQDL